MRREHPRRARRTGRAHHAALPSRAAQSAALAARSTEASGCRQPVAARAALSSAGSGVARRLQPAEAHVHVSGGTDARAARALRGRAVQSVRE